MIPSFLLRYLPHIVALLVICGGVLYYGHVREEKGKEQIQSKWDADTALRRHQY